MTTRELHPKLPHGINGRVNFTSKLLLARGERGGSLGEAHVADHKDVDIAARFLHSARRRAEDECQPYAAFQGEESVPDDIGNSKRLGDDCFDLVEDGTRRVCLIIDLLASLGPRNNS